MNELRRVLDRFVVFMEANCAGLPLRGTRSVHVDAYLRSRRDDGVARATQQRELSYVRRMFQLGVEREFLLSNPCTAIVIAAPSQQETRAAIAEYALSREEQERLIEACSSPYVNRVRLRRRGREITCEMPERPPRYLCPYVVTALESGARRGELLRTHVVDKATGEAQDFPGLLWAEIEWDRNRFSVTGKTGPRKLVLTQRVREALDALRKDQIARGQLQREVFLDDQGKPVRCPRMAFRSAVRRAGIRRSVRLHDLRHSALSNLAQANVPPVVIQRLAGHSSLRMTSHYLHADDDFMVDRVLAAGSAQMPSKDSKRVST